MSAIGRAWARVRAACRRAPLDADLDEELRAHLDLATDDYVRRGIVRDEARRLARVRLGSAALARDVHRDARGLPSLDALLYDLRFAMRALRRDRAFTATVVVTLALAVGLNVTVFAVMDTMLFRGFPLVKGNDRLVYLQERNPRTGLGFSYLDFEDWSTQSSSFEAMAFIGGVPVTLADGGGPDVETVGATVSTNLFGLLGVRPMLGRDFAPGDERPGAPPVVILSYPFWASRFGARTDVIGHTVRVNDAAATVIGVMPAGFAFPEQKDLWMPLAHTPALRQRGGLGGHVGVGRLAPGATVASARADIETIASRLAAAYPATNRGVVPRVETHAQFVVGPDAATIYGTLWGAAWFVLLIACANLANLQLARARRRSDELTTRIALGAGRWRLTRQASIESLLLAGVGGAVAWWIAKSSVHAWAVTTASPYQILDYTIDARTLAYLVGTSMLAAVLCSMSPIGYVLRLDIHGVLKGYSRGTTPGRRAHRPPALMAAQMALAIVLLAGAGVLARSLVNIVDAATGVRDPAHVLIGMAALPRRTYSAPSARLAYVNRLESRLKEVPGVDAVSFASAVPVDSGRLQTFETDETAGRPDVINSVQFLSVGTDYFRVLGARVMTGRPFDDADDATHARVAIVNESFASAYWPGEQPVGKRLRTTGTNQPGEWRTVVGVVSNIMQGDAVRQQFKPLVYLPLLQDAPARPFLLLRTRVSPDDVADVVQAEARMLDPDVALKGVATLAASFGFDRDRMDLEHAELGKYAGVAPVFAAIALLLAAVGLYAVVASAVGQRTREIGVRMALGAAARDIWRAVLRDGMRPMIAGVPAGLAASLAVDQMLRSQLVGVSPSDPVTLGAALAL
jgi:predicted permease